MGLKGLFVYFQTESGQNKFVSAKTVVFTYYFWQSIIYILKQLTQHWLLLTFACKMQNNFANPKDSWKLAPLQFNNSMNSGFKFQNIRHPFHTFFVKTIFFSKNKLNLYNKCHLGIDVDKKNFFLLKIRKLLSLVIKESKLMLTSCSGQCLKCHHNNFVKNTH